MRGQLFVKWRRIRRHYCDVLSLKKRSRSRSQLCHSHITRALFLHLYPSYTTGLLGGRGSNKTSSVKTLGKWGQDNVSSCIQSPGKLSLSSPVWLLGQVCFKWSNTCTKSPSNLLGTGRYSIKVNNYQAPPPPPLTSTALVCLKKPSRYCAASCSTHFTLFLELFSMPGTNAHWSCVTFPQVHPFLAASTMKPICSSRSHHSMMTDTILNDCSSQEYLQFTMA